MILENPETKKLLLKNDYYSLIVFGPDFFKLKTDQLKKEKIEETL